MDSIRSEAPARDLNHLKRLCCVQFISVKIVSLVTSIFLSLRMFLVKSQKGTRLVKGSIPTIDTAAQVKAGKGRQARFNVSR